MIVIKVEPQQACRTGATIAQSQLRRCKFSAAKNFSDSSGGINPWPPSLKYCTGVDNRQAIDRCQCAINNDTAPWNMPCRSLKSTSIESMQACLYVGCPEEATISPAYASGLYPVPATFTCSSNGYHPDAMEYTWSGTHSVTGDISGTGSTITLTEEGTFSLTCTANANFTCTDVTTTLSGTQDGKKQIR